MNAALIKKFWANLTKVNGIAVSYTVNILTFLTSALWQVFSLTIGIYKKDSAQAIYLVADTFKCWYFSFKNGTNFPFPENQH